MIREPRKNRALMLTFSGNFGKVFSNCIRQAMKEIYNPDSGYREPVEGANRQPRRVKALRSWGGKPKLVSKTQT